MRVLAKKNILLTILCTLCVGVTLAQGYPGIVTLDSIDEKQATFTSMGVALKKSDVEINAVQSLFHTLFFTGVDGINDGKPLISNDKPEYTSNFISVKAMMYGGNRTIIREPVKNSQKLFEGVFRFKIPIQNLYKELAQNGVSTAATPKGEVDKAVNNYGVGLPTVIVVPYKKDGQSYDSILQSDFDLRTAVSEVKNGFESRNVPTVDLEAQISAVKRRMEYDASSASSNDKNLLLSSGADVYVTVELQKDIKASGVGSRISLIMSAYETSTGTTLASKNGTTNPYNTTAVAKLCSFAVASYLPPLLDDIVKNLNKQITDSKRVVLQVSIGGSSMMTMDDQVGPNNYRLSDVIRQWIRRNAENGQYHIQGIVAESMIFDYVMIPPTDSDGLMMDAAQFSFLLHSYLAEDQGVSCTSKVDGNTIYLTIE